MKYVIMCGGQYDKFTKHKSLIEVNEEPIVKRTIRLLQENKISKDYISITVSTDDYEDVGVEKIVNKSNDYNNDKDTGYWLDAFYLFDEPCCYLFGDVFYTKASIETIVKIAEKDNNRNRLVGTGIAKNDQHKNWGEPFAYIVTDVKLFHTAVYLAKYFYDVGICERNPITWEVYRIENGFDVNKQYMNDDTYIVIDDGTIDIDDMERVEMIERKLASGEII